jgi:hypothetical protein
MLYVLSLRRRRGLLCSAGEIRPCPQPISAAAAPADEIPRCQVTRCAVSAQGGLGPRVRVCRIYGHALLLPGTDSCGAAGRLGNLQTGLEARVERHMSARGRERVSTNTVAQRTAPIMAWGSQLRQYWGTPENTVSVWTCAAFLIY